MGSGRILNVTKISTVNFERHCLGLIQYRDPDALQTARNTSVTNPLSTGRDNQDTYPPKYAPIDLAIATIDTFNNQDFLPFYNKMQSIPSSSGLTTTM